MKLRLTLGFLVRDGEVLLGLKQRGFGVGLWNGVGGKVKSGESFEGALRREAMEEIGVSIVETERIGNLRFGTMRPPHLLAFDRDCRIYTVTAWQGIPRKIEELDPKWFKIDNIPFSEMWEDDRFWLPLILAGKKITGDIIFDADGRLLKKKILVRRR